MNPEKTEDLKRLRLLAYHREEISGKLVQRFYEMESDIQTSEDAAEIQRVYAWLLTPLTLWPVNVHDLLSECLNFVTTHRRLSKKLRLLIDLLGEKPSEEVCEVVAQHECDVSSGNYEALICADSKFAGTVEERESQKCRMMDEWQRIKNSFSLDAFRNHKGLIRRSTVEERNFRQNFQLRWSNHDAQFQAIFDAFCQKWNLYGMQHDEPLIQKLSVNLTPHGTMIFIPSYWSLDPHRDVNWRAVAKLHRCRVPKRQGATLRENRKERERNAAIARMLISEAKEKKLKGENRWDYICKGLNWDVRTDKGRLSDLLKEFPISGEAAL